jgi:hypothetical protein
VVEIHAPLRADGCTSDPEWDGMVKITIKLSDVRVTIGQIRQILPLLKSRPDLLDLLAEGILVTRRDSLNAFLAELPAAAAYQYELLALIPGIFHHGLTIVPPSATECGRLAFSVHCSVIFEVLNQESKRLAAEGEEAMDKK